MKTLHVKVANKIATLQDQEDAYIVCGNAGYKIQFELDEEWDGVNKTARFIWSGKYHDVEFAGDTCEVPIVSGTQMLSVGLYAGEVPSDEEILSSTLATIPCRLSTRCHQVSASAGTGANYTNEAKGYATEAKEAAERAERASMAYDDSRTYICTDPSNFMESGGGVYETPLYWRGIDTPAIHAPTIVVGLSTKQDMSQDGGSGKYMYKFVGDPMMETVRLCGQEEKIVFLNCITKLEHPFEHGEALKTVYVPSTVTYIHPNFFAESPDAEICCGFSEGDVAYAPWGLRDNGNIRYNYKYREEVEQ